MVASPLRPAPLAPPERPALAAAVLAALDDAKAEEVVALDVGARTSLADLMVIASGRSNVHVNAIAERVIKACKDGGLPAPRVAGLPQCDWAVIDAGDMIVHIFRPETRAFYNLEKMWGGDRPAETAARDVRAAV